LAKIEKAASDNNWAAAAWKLERRYPDVYGRTVQEHTGKDGKAIEHNVAAKITVYIPDNGRN
jgi:hypothetical protein